jgi:8-oxo-dGTP pyrophosphatase MutT (NUDIX family)
MTEVGRSVVLALIRREDRWFLQRRDPANPVLPGLWEFPGGKVEPGERLEAALGRELQEEVGLGLKQAHPGPIQEGSVRLHPYFVEVEGTPRTDLAWGWFTAAEIARLPIPPRNGELLRLLEPDPEGHGPLRRKAPGR